MDQKVIQAGMHQTMEKLALLREIMMGKRMNENKINEYVCGRCNSVEPGLALKDTAGKPRWDLLPYQALEEVVKVYTWAASEKYPPHNWRKGLPWSEAFNAAQRHFKEYHEGEDINPESGLYHIAHMVWWGLALLEYARTHPELDDRWKGAGK